MSFAPVKKMSAHAPPFIPQYLRVKIDYDDLLVQAKHAFAERGYFCARVVDSSGTVNILPPKTVEREAASPKSDDSEKVLLGEGAYGEVYAHNKRGASMVKKVMTGDDWMERRYNFLLEFIIMARANFPVSYGCRFIVASHVCTDYRPGARMTLPCLGRVNLRTVELDLEDGLEPAIAQDRLKRWLKIFEQVCIDAAALHRLGMMHLDIKPGNIMETGKLVDAGAALHYTEARCKTDMRTTPYYKPGSLLLVKEQMHDFSVDVYSIAISLMEKMDWDVGDLRDYAVAKGILHAESRCGNRRYTCRNEELKDRFQKNIKDFMRDLEKKLQTAGMLPPQIGYIIGVLTHMSQYDAVDRLSYAALPAVADSLRRISDEYTVIFPSVEPLRDGRAASVFLNSDVVAFAPEEAVPPPCQFEA